MEDDQAPKKEKSGLWKNLLYTFVGTTLSILLTFGTSQLLAMRQQKEERKLTAMMVISNIEQYAQKLETIYQELTWRDSLATMLLSIPTDSLDVPWYSDRVRSARMVAAAPGFNYDKSVEQIFSNSIDTWKNMGNFKFIDNVGQCFSSMEYIREDYISFIAELGNCIEQVKKNPEAYSGKSVYGKLMHSHEFRSALQQIHNRSTYYRYLAEFIRYKNAINMQLMGVGEEEVLQFINEREKDEEIDKPIPQQTDYLTPALSADSLPDFETFMNRHRV